MSKHIWISEKLKSELDTLKTHPRDTYGDVVQKAVEAYKISEISTVTLKTPIPEETPVIIPTVNVMPDGSE